MSIKMAAGEILVVTIITLLIAGVAVSIFYSVAQKAHASFGKDLADIGNAIEQGRQDAYHDFRHGAVQQHSGGGLAYQGSYQSTWHELVQAQKTLSGDD